MIPNKVHFVWLGNDLPWIRFLSIPSAISHGGFDSAIFHYEPGLEQSPIFREIQRLDKIELRPIEPDTLLCRLPSFDGVSINDVYHSLESPTARANVLRAAILWLEGGVYLDLDTITVRSFKPLLSRCDAFYGVEHIINSLHSRESTSAGMRIKKRLRRFVRRTLRQSPNGWRAFRAIESFYPTAANNAVVGTKPEHPFFGEILAAMTQVPLNRRQVRFSLGTHLLQEVAYSSTDQSIEVLEPSVFYPLGPEISEHWFRSYRRVPDLNDVISTETLVVHWYASVRTKHLMPLVDDTYIKNNAGNQLFSRLVTKMLDL